MNWIGHLDKMTALSHTSSTDETVVVDYFLNPSQEFQNFQDVKDFKVDREAFKLPLNSLLGKKVKLTYLQQIHCCACGKLSKKSYQNGYCFPCTQKLAECDMCILKPELCHFRKGTCRDESFAKSHCLRDHVVYLAKSSAVKVGITRMDQIPTRFIDQGATSFLPIFKVSERYHSGLIEDLLRSDFADKTDWRKMLQNQVVEADLALYRDEIFENFERELDRLAEKNQIESMPIDYLEDWKERDIIYPVLSYPEKVKSLTLEKHPVIEAVLQGIKGQYLIFDSGVFNVRNHSSYLVNIEI